MHTVGKSFRSQIFIDKIYILHSNLPLRLLIDYYNTEKK